MGKKKRDLYTNSLALSSSAFEFSINFKKQMINEDMDDQVLEDVALIRMSPQLARALSDMLLIHLEKQEKDIET